MKTFRILTILTLFIFLTVLTQVGGIVLLIALTFHKYINRQVTHKWWNPAAKVATFLVLYAATTFVIVPLLARPLGRVPMPLLERGHLRPLTVLTCLLNRHYVRPELRRAAFEVAEEMNRAFPGTTVNYLDGNFPFGNHFPLVPHLSHNDGRKLDLAFCYTDNHTLQPTNESPSVIGYGVCEAPRAGEQNTASFCDENGYWQYSLSEKVVPQGGKKDYTLDEERTRRLVNLFAAHSAIGKIFIEPHLKGRMKLTSSKIRFHGCRAVRHDDHIHVQLK